MRGAVRVGVLSAVGVLLCAASGCRQPNRLPAPELLPPRGAGTSAPPAEASPNAVAQVTLDFAWTDFDGERRSCQLTFPQADLDASRGEFGCDPELLKPQEFRAHRTYSYTPEQARDPAEMARLEAEADAAMQTDLAAAEAEHRQKLTERGFTYLSEDTVSVDLAWLWQRNQPRLAAVARQLREAVGEDDFARAALAFVQELPYQELPDTIDSRYVGGVLPPLETLAVGYGDCDSKALLWACLVDDGSGPEVIVLRGPDHMVAGLACAADAPGYRATAFGGTWQLCECSHGAWEPGQLDDSIYQQIADGKFEPVRLRPSE